MFMEKKARATAAQIRQRLGHPVVDADGHVIEFLPALVDCLKRVAGPKVSDRFWKAFLDTNARNWHQLTAVERRRGSVYRPAFWAGPAENTRDRATAMLPKLLDERMPELGIDYAVMFPTIGMLLPNIVDEEMRRASCRAENMMLAEMFQGCESRLTPAAIIPCHTPAEALEEMDFALGELGMKVPMIGSLVRRPIHSPGAGVGEPRPLDQAFWVDLLGMDSEYDYDPLWKRCMELRVPMNFHAPSQGVGLRRSPSNYMFNQTGHFADSGHAFAKALFFGGVTHRFPDLPMAFLECGAAWGAQLVLDLKERWEKRNAEAIRTLDPRRVDFPEMVRLFDRYGGPLLAGKMTGTGEAGRAEQPDVDEFAATGVRSLDDLYDRLLPNYYFGCEADDRLAGTAFDPRYTPPGRKLKAMFSSDIGHWDVAAMDRVVPEAFEMVEDGVMSAEDFRDFIYANPVRLLTSLNPDFFEGTAVAREVKALLHADAGTQAPPRARAGA
jgi:predicted TIM-barrel fold metal-dependent hydrolase